MEGVGIGGGFWRGRKVFLTGHTGFKGAWLSLLLNQLGAEVTGFSAAPPSGRNLFELGRVSESVRSLEGDIRDLDSLKSSLADAEPDVAIHLAAQALVRRSYRDPVETYSTNVMGTVNFLEAVRAFPQVKSAIVVTSDKCYENQDHGFQAGFTETDPMGGHDPYSCSKGCAELVTTSYRQSYFMSGQPALASVRAGNVIGGGDWAEDRLIPDCVESLAASRPVEIRNPHAVRPWQHVLEPLRGYLMLAQQLYERGQECASGWNFGPNPDDARPVCDVVEQIVRLWGPPAEWTTDAGQHPHEAAFLRLDCSKALAQLGWSPLGNLELALRWTVNWYQRVFAGGDAREVTREQIEEFLQLEEKAAWKHRDAGFAKAS